MIKREQIQAECEQFLERSEKKTIREPTGFEPLAKKFCEFREKQKDLVEKKSEKSVLSVGEKLREKKNSGWQPLTVDTTERKYIKQGVLK